MTQDELFRRLLAGSSPDAIGPDTADLAEISGATRALEALSLTSEPVAPSRGLRSAILDAAVPGRGLGGFARRTARFFQIDEAYARELLASVDDVEAEPWYDDEVPGVRVRDVEAGPRNAEASCMLVHISPGIRYPSHRHLGDEWCLFLQGRGLEADREWNPGDLVLKPRGSDHPELAADLNEPFVFGVVLHRGLEWLSAGPEDT